MWTTSFKVLGFIYLDNIIWGKVTFLSHLLGFRMSVCTSPYLWHMISYDGEKLEMIRMFLCRASSGSIVYLGISSGMDGQTTFMRGESYTHH